MPMIPFAVEPDGCVPGTSPAPGTDSSVPASGADSAFGPGGLLAFTGADFAMLAGIGVTILLVGVMLFLIARRRRRGHPKASGRNARAGAVALSLLLVVGLGLAGTPSPAQAATAPPVEIVTACDFLQLSGVTVSADLDDGLMPGETTGVVTATITNQSTFAADIFLSTEVGSDPKSIAPFTTLTARTSSSVVYAGGLGDPIPQQAARLQPGESVVLIFRASVSGNAGNPQQAARIVFDIVITAIEAV